VTQPKRDIPVRVLLGAAEAASRRRLAQALSDRGSFELAGEAGSTSQALRLIRSRAPDVVVLEDSPPKLDGLEVLRETAAEGTDASVLLLSGTLEPRDLYEALRLGARGLISSGERTSAVRRAITAVARGETVLGQQEQIALAEEIRGQAPAPEPRLTERERQVLSLAAKGATAAEVARSLHLSENTVKTYLFRIYKKLGVTGRAAAVMRAMREGFLQLAIAGLLWQDSLTGAGQALDLVS
jgi:DNA-binding NarL/FixJ family response regulator